MSGNNFPTTDKYNLGVDININAPSVRSAFNNAMAGQPMSEKRIGEMVNDALGHNLISTHYVDGVSVYLPAERSVNISQETIAGLLGVAPDNLPPNIPEELTPELLTHLVALHETEHGTQTSFEFDDSTGRIDAKTIQYHVLNTSEGYNNVSYENMKEVDADLAILTHLDDMGLENVSQFWLDMRICASFNHKFIETEIKPYEHDASSIAAYFRETGEVLDPNHFIEQKNLLMSKLQVEVMGVDMSTSMKTAMSVFKEYPAFNETHIPQMSEFLRNTPIADLNKKITPQSIMHEVNELIDEGKLEGIQKWEAENYITAMERLGYEPAPMQKIEINIEDIFRDVLENKMGLQRAGQDAVNEANHEEPVISANVNGM